MQLQDLPIEVLAQILVGEASIEAIGLWMTWNRQMMAKLVNGAVRELEIGTLTVNASSKWPQYLKLWKLKSLRISSLKWHSNRRIGPLLRAELRQLWSGLERLEIDGDGVELAFELQNSKPTKPSTSLRNPPTKKAKLSDSPAEAKDTGDWNMNTTHPHLTRLKIASSRTSPKTRLKFGSITFLPQSLAHLDVSGTFFTIDASECAHLPPQLETLILPATSVITEHNIGALPPSLTQVHTAGNTGSCFTSAALLALARDPKVILPNLAVFPGPYDVLMWYNLYHVAGDKWRLNTLDMYIYSSGMSIKANDFVNVLPEPWESAWRRQSFYSATPTALWLSEALPESLTKLSVDAIDWKSDPSYHVWPATLTSVELRNDMIPQSYFSALPRNLKELTVRSTGYHPDRSALLLQGQTSLSKVDEQKWRQLKLELQSERDREPDLFQKTQFDQYIAEVEKGGLYGLPLTLERILVTAWYPLSCGIMLYPPKLKSADSFPTLKPDASALETLPPRSLTQLNIRINRNDRNLWPNGEVGSESLKHSKSIKKMLLIHSGDCTCDHLLLWLPRDLQELSLYSVISEIGVLRTLPQHLRVLQLRRPPPNPADLWAELMPRTLEVLHVPQWVLQGADCSKMPPRLERFIVKVANDLPFSMEQFEQLPSTLHHGFMAQHDDDEEKRGGGLMRPQLEEIPWRFVRAFMVQFLKTQYPTSLSRIFSH